MVNLLAFALKSDNSERHQTTTRSSRANTPVPPTEATAAARTRVSTARTASTTATPRPQWGATARTTATSNNYNVSTPPQSAIRRTAPATGGGGSLAVPGTAQRTRTPGQGLLSRMTSRDSLRQAATKTPARASTAQSSTVDSYDGTREPLKAYLRIRPAPEGVPLQSYIQVLNETDVLMVPPADHRLNPSSSSASLFSNALLRSSNLNLNPASHPSGVPDDVLASPTPYAPDPSTYGTLYKFTSVFPSSAAAAGSASGTPLVSPTSPTFTAADRVRLQQTQSQAAFFRSTTLPLVRDFLHSGENCLLFAYGPTGSGKTYTVQGGTGEDAGLLPRVVEVVWKSLEARRQNPRTTTPPAGQRRGGPLMSTPNGKQPAPERGGESEEGDESDVVSIDGAYDYAVMVSYSEVYNEKIYDLLDSPLPSAPPSTPAAASSHGGGGMFKGLFKNFTTVKRSALSLKADKSAPAAASGQSAPKVVGGLKEIKVSSAEEAHNVLARGQSHRRVFSTLANRASSRSHSIFTLKLVRTHRATGTELTSRFSIVDLAGSERVVNTQTTGDRLKEAGNINKSLMVLGQCMEVLRKNQEREKGRKPAIVPFRHSKLTEMFQSFFIGDGKAVMVVNVNPYETGFDENSHVMKFSAVAKGVMTVKRGPDAYLSALPPVPTLPIDFKIPEIKKANPEPRLVRVSLVDNGDEEEVLYEEEDLEDDDGEEDEFVNALLDELSSLRTALFESQMQVELAQSTVRAQVVKEYEEKMLEMERRYQARLREEADEAETKLNAKLDILTRLQAAKTPGRGGPAAHRLREESLTPSTTYDDSDEEDVEGASEDAGVATEREDRLVEEDEEGTNDSEEVERMLMPVAEDTDSPLAARVNSLSLMDPKAGRPPAKTPSPLAHATLTPEEEVDDELAHPEPVPEQGARKSSMQAEAAEDDGSDADGEASFEANSSSDQETSARDFVVPLRSESDAAAPVRRIDDKGDKENESPLGGHGDRTLGEIDALGLDKSMVIRSSGGGAKKTKRKLGVKVVDVEDIDTYEGVLSPIRKTPGGRHLKP
ncbi:hypothetical protein JCM10908_006590 [Rhodotorula pacifica]|uniref:uncharacterized protein n=1 Tax=Rhodotorula pacifica TaxID=1495444 RepID=UPI003174533D